MRAPSESPETREQLIDRKRFGQVVIGAGVQPVNAVVQRIACCQHEHRRLPAGSTVSPADLEAVQIRQSQIEYHEIVRAHRKGLERGPARVYVINCPRNLPEGTAEEVGQLRLVFDDQDAHGTLFARRNMPRI
jgi:hypothetical protein